jgi:hypothetical protein
VHYLACLLRHPHQEFYVLDLVSVGAGGEAATGKAGKQIGELARLGLQTSGVGDAGEILDPQARMAYKRRLKELREELTEAQELDDPERAARMQQEINFLARELSGAVGLGGRSRKAASATERARVNVTRAIKVVIKKIAEHHPVLEHHLNVTVKTGTFCSYAPEPHAVVSWEF